MIQLHDKKFQPYISSDTIEDAIQKIAHQIHSDFSSSKQALVLLPILNGSFMFAGTLCKYMSLPLYIEFVKISSYRGEKSAFPHEMDKINLKTDLNGKDVIIIEDILDSGATLTFFIEYLRKICAPRAVKIACLFRKKDTLQYPIEADYVGLSIENKFVVGYGLDYNGLGRNLNGLYSAAT